MNSTSTPFSKRRRAFATLETMARAFAKGEAFVARRLLRLPAKALVALSRKAPIVLDGQTLHPEMQFLLEARRLRGAGFLRDTTPQRARDRMRKEAMHYAFPVRVGGVRELEVPGGSGTLKARHYVPDEGSALGSPAPLLVFFHGGGFVTGDLDTHDSACRILCTYGGVHVLSVDYRLAPEHPFPAAVDDVLAATRWAQEHAASLGADPKRVGVGGDSAGGNLATVTALVLHEEAAAKPGPALPPLAMQLLLYPVVDRTKDRGSMRTFADGFLLTYEDIRWFDKHYYGDEKSLLQDTRLTPLFSKNLHGLPPAIVVTAGFDPLRDEGDEYAAALQKAGVKTTLERVDGFVHGFINLTDVSPAAHDALVKVAKLVRKEFGGAH